jgi:hypothetical protein
MADMTQTNRKPPDELADVRERMKQLKHREDELKASLIAGEVDLVGDEFIAKISQVTSERINSPKLRKEVAAEQLKPYLVTSTATVVNVERMAATEDENG